VTARAPLVESAPAKINLTLEIRGRRSDGYHELESLIVFARVGDRLRFVPGEAIALDLRGPFAAALGGGSENLVLKAARELGSRVEGLKFGRFELWKRLPVASGVGGGSSDAAAALRVLARLNSIALDDPRLTDAACATGADVPVCLAARARLVRGIGEQLSDPIDLPKLAAVLVNPAVALATKDVFGAFGSRAKAGARAGMPSPLDANPIPRKRDELVSWLGHRGNDLEETAIALAPAIAEVLAQLRALPRCELARMSGSGATCLGIFTTSGAVLEAARNLRASHPRWWVCATTLG
jgi:4-diphosphocytidyl-2-C-methyl-D-erythritol kinase